MTERDAAPPNRRDQPGGALLMTERDAAPPNRRDQPGGAPRTAGINPAARQAVGHIRVAMWPSGSFLLVKFNQFWSCNAKALGHLPGHWPRGGRRKCRCGPDSLAAHSCAAGNAYGARAGRATNRAGSISPSQTSCFRFSMSNLLGLVQLGMRAGNGCVDGSQPGALARARLNLAGAAGWCYPPLNRREDRPDASRPA
jgi:hypothetical protein